MTMEKKSKHWPVIIVVLLLSGIFLFSLFTFQVAYGENAVLLRLGKPLKERILSPGLHFKWPFESVWRVDGRIQCFEGNTGALEEVFTNDGKNIIVGVYLGWRVSKEKCIHFLERVGSLRQAEAELTTLLRSYKGGVFGMVEFDSLINIDATRVRIHEVEQKLLELIQKDALELYGIEVQFLGIHHLGLPEIVTSKVFERMKIERQNKAQRILSEGESLAVQIRAQADKESTIILAEAESKAKSLRAEGDAEAAKNYATFQQNPELASFLRKLDSIKRTLTEESVLVLDTNTAPFDLLQSDSIESLGIEKSEKEK